MRTVFILFLLACITSACSAQVPNSVPTDIAPDALSTPLLQPVYTQTPIASDSSQADSISPALVADEHPNSYWVTNPASGSRLFVTAFYPSGWSGDPLPALVLVPGGTGVSEPQKATRLAEEGFLVIIFDPEGRGRSEGVEDYNGTIGQDGLAAVVEAATALPGLDASRYGLVSFSYGVTMATGALARHPNLPIDFYIDWEGPVSRMYTTTGCGTQAASHIQWQPCSDHAWWAEREALNFIADVQVPYQRVQSQKDHVQTENTHAVEIVNAAVTGGLPWVRLNEYPAGQTYDLSNPPAMLTDTLDRQLEKTIAAYAWYIIETIL